MGIHFTVEIMAREAKKQETVGPKAFGRLGRKVDRQEDHSASTTVKVNDADSSLERNRMVFECIAGRSVHLLSVQYVSAGTDSTSKNIYRGISRSNRRLNTPTAREWKEYLADKGIDDQLAGYILAIANEKESKEYSLWLTEIHSFINK
jgi:hypothetical protein